VRRIIPLIGLLVALVLLVNASAASARPSVKKAIWGPLQYDGRDQFPIYADLGVGIYEMSLSWAETAIQRPTHPANPHDPAYLWPSNIDVAVREAAHYGIAVSVQLMATPSWANGGRSSNFAPAQPADFAAFAQAAARRYPGVHLWMIWGEPSKAAYFQPVGRGGVRLYARMLDAAYDRIKAVNQHDLVIGGNTWTAGDVPPLRFIRWLRLPSGRPPRMDLYGHNPFSDRRPDLRQPPLGGDFADFSDLGRLAGAIDRNLGRTPSGKPIRLFLSEFSLPTDHPNWEFNFYVSRATQARWLGDALRIVRSWSRVYALGYLGLYDDPPRPGGAQVERGLLDLHGRPKPAYAVFKRG
jgi:hypothetical protein